MFGFLGWGTVQNLSSPISPNRCFHESNPRSGAQRIAKTRPGCKANSNNLSNVFLSREKPGQKRQWEKRSPHESMLASSPQNRLLELKGRSKNTLQFSLFVHVVKDLSSWGSRATFLVQQLVPRLACLAQREKKTDTFPCPHLHQEMPTCPSL